MTVNIDNEELKRGYEEGQNERQEQGECHEKEEQKGDRLENQRNSVRRWERLFHSVSSPEIGSEQGTILKHRVGRIVLGKVVNPMEAWIVINQMRS
jgi:hypothetical protein